MTTEWNAAEYVRRSALQETMAKEALSLLHLNGSERVLDVGCGEGRITAEIARRLPRGSALGVDSSSNMISLAERRIADGGIDNLRFAAIDARSLEFREEFDLIVSFNALHWMHDPNPALARIRRAVKPRGRAQLRLVPKGERKSLEDVIEETRKSPAWAAYFVDFHDPYLHLRPEQYAEAAEKNGFSVGELRTSDQNWDFQSREAFLAFGTVTFVEWTKRLPPAERPAFIADVLHRYQTVACASSHTGSGEEHVFKFYQMDITLFPHLPAPR